ncbi:HesB/YadR/YfhF family protein [Sporosarcina jiandibaonis]|uniref:HesB/YadR/YfhF family protein n=1 Tax=Sporosarcina jiandibaonis TaxID=2715535 RepID=UPI0015573AE9|nr:HesB/YadR/YfhF family protein [Sporosarcina jiandibaonis]
MKIVVSNEAVNWFKEEMEAVPGDSIRFFARYGGASPLHEGFSLGVTKENPDEVAVEKEIDGIRYYIEYRDKWYFLEHDLHVDLDSKVNELVYSYKKS